MSKVPEVGSKTVFSIKAEMATLRPIGYWYLERHNFKPIKLIFYTQNSAHG